MGVPSGKRDKPLLLNAVVYPCRLDDVVNTFVDSILYIVGWTLIVRLLPKPQALLLTGCSATINTQDLRLGIPENLRVVTAVSMDPAEIRID